MTHSEEKRFVMLSSHRKLNWFSLGTAMILVLAMAVAHGQTSTRDERRTISPPTVPSTSLEGLFDASTRSLRTPAAIPMDEPVDENEYIVGPNDILAIMIPGLVEMPTPVTVSPEGKILFPNIGAIDVKNRTLAEVKELVGRSFKLTKPTLTLVSPRQFLVTVLGSVQYPGPFLASSVLRLDKVVFMANIPPSSLIAEERKPPPDFSKRRIVLRRKGKPDRMLDLEKYYAFHISSENPTLIEGDIIVVPTRNVEQRSISVYGAVNAPNQFEYREGDSLRMLITFAQGLTADADSSNVELTRLSTDATTAETRILDIGPILRGESPDVPLNLNDRILVRKKLDRRRDYKVHVRGEVRMPGMYPITPDSTRLSDIIRRAGGFTEFARLASAEVVRKQLTPEGENINMDMEAQLNARMNDQLVTPEERGYYDLEARLRRGTVSVDFVRLFEGNDRSADILLQDGDIVFVPNTQKNVYVYGQVGRPGFVSYKKGEGVEYYIALAGGYGEEADDGKTRVIKALTREWLNPSDTEIHPGDYIWVPKDIRYPASYYWNLISQAASFISVVLSMTVIILQLSK
jgi:protein involved in polysaccharide export with SLBB domain